MQQLLGTGEDEPGGCREAAKLNAVGVQEDTATKRARLKPIDRSQNCLRAVIVDDLIDPDHNARAIWEFVGELDLSEFHEDIRAFEGEAGRSALHPQLLISLWIFAFSIAVGKAREISRLCDHHPAFQWLTGMQSISYHTLSSFRILHKSKLDELFKQVLAILDSEEIIDLRRLFHDGTKIEADASSGSFHCRDKVEKNLQLAEQVIAQLETENCEEQNRRLRAAKERAANQRKESLQKAIHQFKQLPATTKRKHQTRVSETDPEARNMIKADGGYAPAYNAQITTEGKNGFIVALHLSQSSSDFGELLPAVQNAIANTGIKPQEMVLDAGFNSKKNIIKLSKQDVRIVGPILPQSSTVEQLAKRGIDPDFNKQAFQFDSEKNQFICPTGKILSYVSSRNGKVSKEHLYRASKDDCHNCPLKEKCCGHVKSFQRMLIRSEDHPEVTIFKQRMDTEEAKAIYKKRSQFAEFPFVWIKEKFGLRRFHVRGLDKSLTELLWVSLTFNILWFLRIKRKLSLNPSF